MLERNKNEEEIYNLQSGKDVVVMQPSVTEDEDEIDLGKIAGVLLDHLHYIILCFMIGALLFNAYAYFKIHPTYQSTAKLYMVSASEDAVVNFADLNIGQALTSDYEELIYSYPVMDAVLEKLHLDVTEAALESMITITNPDNTRVLRVTATSEDPELSMNIANTLVEVVIEYLPKTMSTTSPNIAQKARLNPKKVGPGYLKYTLIGAILFAGAYCTILIVLFLLDDTIKGGEDLESDFGIVPLAMIPESEVFAEEEEVLGATSFVQRLGIKRAQAEPAKANNTKIKQTKQSQNGRRAKK